MGTPEPAERRFVRFWAVARSGDPGGRVGAAGTAVKPLVADPVDAGLLRAMGGAKNSAPVMDAVPTKAPPTGKP
jgi:hypothetical protein